MNPLDTPTIVIADDNPMLLSVLRQILEESGWIVRTASDGFGALAEIRTRTPEMLLSDLNMAGMSGFELLSVVRRKYPSIPVIAMSGAYTGLSIPHGVAADSFYAKGFGDVRKLLDLVACLAADKDFPGLRKPVPIWAARIQLRTIDPESLLVTCPECLRAFVQPREMLDGLDHEASCRHCLRVFHLSLVKETCGVDMSSIRASATHAAIDAADIAIQVRFQTSAASAHQ